MTTTEDVLLEDVRRDDAAALLILADRLDDAGAGEARPLEGDAVTHSPLVTPPVLEIPVPPEFRRGVRPNRKRNSDCFGRSFRYVIARGEDVDVSLVHGVYLPCGLAHGWAEFVVDGRWVVFDGNWHRFYDRAVYYEHFSAVPVVRYTRGDALEAGYKAGCHYGPWDMAAYHRFFEGTEAPEPVLQDIPLFGKPAEDPVKPKRPRGLPRKKTDE
jgi:hypothetical protein